MKILIAISDSFCANFIKGQGQFLSDNGHEVIIVSGPGKEIDDLAKNESVKVVKIPFSREISLKNDFKSLIEVIKLVKTIKPDVVNAGNPKTGLLFSLAHLFYWKTPLIFTLRGIRSDTLLGFKKSIVKVMEKITVVFANKVIAISPSLRQHAIDIGMVNKNKIVVLSKGSSNGLSVEKFTINDEINSKALALRADYMIPDAKFYLLYVGRVTKDKGLKEVFDALNICWKNGANIQFIIAGPIEKDDPLPEEYYKMLETNENITYLGKQLDVRPVYAIGDALVLYSYREGFGNVVIEASSMKLPTIVADIPGLRDTTENGVTGLIINPRNSYKLSEGIMKLYNNRSLSIKMGLNGRKRVEQYFRNEIVWSMQLELYKKLCK